MTPKGVKLLSRLLSAWNSDASWRVRSYRSRIVSGISSRARPRPSSKSKMMWSTEQPWLKPRSEEHTSELQSLMRISYAVFCLKKKNSEKSIHTQVVHNVHQTCN